MAVEIKNWEVPRVEATWNTNHEVHVRNLENGMKVVGISSQTWEDFFRVLSSQNFVDEIVVSPELITTASDSQVDMERSIIASRIQQVLQESKKFPKATILLGTPLYEGQERPQNAVLGMKAGKIIGMVHKRSPVTEWEQQHFSFKPNDRQSSILGEDVGVIICGDLTTAMMQSLGGMSETVLRNSGKENLIGQNSRVVDERARSLIVVSCWGVGANPQSIRTSSIDQYYKATLQMAATDVLKDRKNNVHKIIVVDRSLPDPEKLEATQPFNAMFTIEKLNKKQQNKILQFFSWRRQR